MNTQLTTKELIYKNFGFDLPISGGDGSTMEKAIKIDKEYEDWSDVLYTCLRLLNRLESRDWGTESATTMKNNGRTYDRMKLQINNREEYVDYYFDLTDHMHGKLFGGGTNWPDEDIRPGV